VAPSKQEIAMPRTLTLNSAIAATSARSESLLAKALKLLRVVFCDFNRYADAAHMVHAPDTDRQA
jgi:hypothetical protein